jgi:DNA-binding NarL/FixJ family response regulator
VTRVLIVAAAARTRRALEAQLPGRDFEVAGSVASLAAVEDVFEGRIDAVLIEVSEGGTGEGLELLEESGLARETPVVVLLEEAAPDAVSQFLRLGVRGVLPADIQPGQVAVALEAAVGGLLVLAPGEVGAVRPAGGTRDFPDELVEPLTPREKEVLRLLATGMSNKEIAARLKLSDHTAKFHVASILGKLGASSRAEAVSIGMRHGLILL